ncbi:MAG TPA: phosphatidylserine/phosphatidylglycerophosphate/cardiolipin synthase family protein, partial [Peptococcaceae bacterium]|nr:phosphatidylserine/phosphatidylglycerophosphate/cardiolipin synthase family protein [Peptococcaceae bacterium]
MLSKKLFILFIVISSLFISGCNNNLLPFFQEEKTEIVSNLTASSILLNSNEIRSQTIQLINNAKKAIFIQLSALSDQEIIDLLINKSHSGVEVRILLDQWLRDNSVTVKKLKNQNVSVQYYPAQKGQYHRVRYLVIDHQVSVFYSQDLTSKGFNAHGIAIKLTGDTAWTMAKSFKNEWEYTTTLTLNLPEKIDLPEDNITFTVNAGVKQQVLRAINSATSEIMILTEQLSDPDTVQALKEAKARGCNIQLILSPSCATATPNTIKEFQNNKIEFRYF